MRWIETCSIRAAQTRRSTTPRAPPHSPEEARVGPHVVRPVRCVVVGNPFAGLTATFPVDPQARALTVGVSTVGGLPHGASEIGTAPCARPDRSERAGVTSSRRPMRSRAFASGSRIIPWSG